MKQFEIFYELKQPYKTHYNDFGDNVDFYKSLNIGLNNGHTGQDSIAIDQTRPAFTLAIFPIYAGIDGWVYRTEPDNKGGWGVEVISNEKFLDINGQPFFWKVRYWHILKDGILVKAGQKVRVGDILCWGDNTGLSQKSHCHRDTKPGDVKGDIFIKAFPDNGWFGAVNDEVYMSKKKDGAYYTAYELRSNLTKISEAIELLGRKIAEFIKNRK